jgi:hypothetical protein
MAQAPQAVRSRHGREDFFIKDEGIIGVRLNAASIPVTQDAESRKFRFSRLFPKGKMLDLDLLFKVAQAMTAGVPQQVDGIPAGFTYLGQFVDHDLTFDRTRLTPGSEAVLADIENGRTPTLDLDCLYGDGPQKSPTLYKDGIRFDIGKTQASPFPNTPAAAAVDLDDHDLKRIGFGSTKRAQRQAVIGDPRNDENLAVAQTHVAFLNFHNQVVEKLVKDGTPGDVLFAKARDVVTRHYQWMLRHDFLPRIIEADVLDDVFANGRRVFEVDAPPLDRPTMPIEFSVASYRFGHTMPREVYEWNKVFNDAGLAQGSLAALFQFSGLSGNLSPTRPEEINDPDSGGFLRLPSNWVADWRRLFDFGPLGDKALVPAKGEENLAQRIDTLLVPQLGSLPLGSIDGLVKPPPTSEQNLAFRNLARAGMLLLCSGQQAAAVLNQLAIDLKAPSLKVDVLTEKQILAGKGGADLSGLTQAQKDTFVADTPLWFYILREAEVNKGKLKGVGARITAEVFHRTMEKSETSIVRDPAWKPDLGPRPGTFEMIDLLHFAFGGNVDRLNPMGP